MATNCRKTYATCECATSGGTRPVEFWDGDGTLLRINLWSSSLALLLGVKENSVRQRIQLMTGLRKLQEEYPQIGDVRGKGLMIGTEFIIDGKQAKAKQLVKDVIHSAEEKGMLLLSCGTYDNTVRWIPPLNVTTQQINDGLKIFNDSLKEVVK